MKTVDLILCLPISPWAFTNISQKQCLKTSKQYWRQNSTRYSEFYRYPWGGWGKRSHWAQTHQQKEFYISFVSLSLLFCSHRRLESTKWWQNHQHFRHAFCVFICCQASEKWPVNLPVYLASPSHYQHISQRSTETPQNTHTHTHTPIRVNRPPLLGYWSAK